MVQIANPSSEVTPSSMLKAFLEGLTVLTIALALAHTIVQPQYSLKASEASSTVSTKAFLLETTNLRRSSRLFNDYI
jgi:hypothetical protein